VEEEYKTLTPQGIALLEALCNDAKMRYCDKTYKNRFDYKTNSSECSVFTLYVLLCRFFFNSQLGSFC